MVAVLLLQVSWVAPGRSHCQMFVRSAVQVLHGHKYDQYHKRTAHLSALAWKKSPFWRKFRNDSVPGDIVYWYGTKRNPAGHCAIRLPGNKYAENSVVHWPGSLWGKGLRLVYRVRPPDLIVRLPGRIVP